MIFLIKLCITLLVSLCSAFCYHAGGLGSTSNEEQNEDTWVPLFMRKSWVRDWLCPLFSLTVLFIWWQPNIWYGYLLSIPAYGLMGAALSTYWDFLFNNVDNFFIHGFFVGLSFFPFYFVGMHWWAILINAIASAILMGWLCARTKSATLEEMGRGLISSITRALLVL